MRRLAAAAVLLLPLAACATAPDEVGTGHVERTIARQAERQGVTVRVDCPTRVPWEPGRTFHCVARSDGERVMVDVTVENDSGEFTWEARP